MVQDKSCMFRLFNALGDDTDRKERVCSQSPAGVAQVRTHVGHKIVPLNPFVKNTRGVTPRRGTCSLRVRRRYSRLPEAAVMRADTGADNGVVHAVDQVILPERFLYSPRRRGHATLSTLRDSRLQ